MLYIEAPDTIKNIGNRVSLFLAGGISNCSDWQAIIADKLKPLDLIVFNPRRKNFDAKNKDIEREQIEWEHRHLMISSIVSFWFCKDTLCPITLFELGKMSALVHTDGGQLPFKPIIVGMDPDYKRRIDLEIQLPLIRPDIKIVYSLK